MNRLPVMPLVLRGLRIAEAELGMAELARRLGVEPGTVDDWRTGVATMPQDKFLELVDVLSAIDPDWNKADPSLAAKARRIIIVDDNADAAITLAHLLGALGHDATAVVDPRKAIEVAREVRPQIAIIDLNMPHVGGLELARLFRRDRELRHICLVALTAMDGLEYREKTRQVGFDAHLRKPADAPLLRAILEQFG